MASKQQSIHNIKTYNSNSFVLFLSSFYFFSFEALHCFTICAGNDFSAFSQLFKYLDANIHFISHWLRCLCLPTQFQSYFIILYKFFACLRSIFFFLFGFSFCKYYVVLCNSILFCCCFFSPLYNCDIEIVDCEHQHHYFLNKILSNRVFLLDILFRHCLLLSTNV